MCAAFDLCGNASSVHAEGRTARAIIEAARAKVSAFAGVAPKNVVFTSGGTEALNLALTPSIETPDEKRPFGLLVASVQGNIRRSLGAIVLPRRNLNLSA